MVAVALRAASFVTSRSFTVQTEQFSCGESIDRVGEYVADYSELTSDELAARDPHLDDLLARSRVVSVKSL